jgi:predicted Zn-dependent peptidase
VEKIEIKKLKNGIPVLMEDVKSINTVSLGIFVKTGTKNELPGEEGVSHFLEHMMFKGTETRSAKDISEEIDNIGGIINAYTSKENTVYYVQVLSSQIGVGVDVLADMFLNSTFTEENLDKERNVIIEEIRMYEDIPEETIHDENVKLCIEGVQSKPVLGTEESLKGISREKLVNYFQSRYTPNNIIISVVGNIDEEKLFEQLDKTFGTIPEKVIEREYNGEMQIKSGGHLIQRDTNQVHLCFNTIGTSTKDNRKYPLAMISTILAGNMSSRLFQKIREEKGLAYSVYAYTSSFEEGGVFTVYAGTTKDSWKEVIEMIKAEFKEIRENGITAYELQKAKNQFLSMVTFGLENSKGRMNRMASSYLLYGEVKDVEEIIAEVEKLTLDDIRECAKEIFDERYYSQTVLGDI